MTETIAGVAIPDSPMCKDATDYICDNESPLLYHHSRRTYLFGMLHGRLRDQYVDPELLYVAAMFHDIGLVEGHRNLQQRFEVDGAGLDDLDPVNVSEVVAAHPRLDFKRKSLATFADGFKDRPDTTFGAITADVLEYVCPDFRPKNFVEVVRNNGWTE
jgi:hypothetical protein